MKKPVTRTMNKPMQARQGDVFFKPVDNLPEGLKKLDHAIFAWGEVTGHKHEVLNLENVDYFQYEGKDPFVVGYAHVKEAEPVVHEDHEGFNLYPGYYEVRNQCEIEVDNEDNEAFKRVLD